MKTTVADAVIGTDEESISAELYVSVLSHYLEQMRKVGTVRLSTDCKKLVSMF
jgi:hypothetical protein